MKKNRTEHCKKLYFFFSAVSILIFVSVALFTATSVLLKIAKPSIGSSTSDQGIIQLTDSFKKTLISFGFVTILTTICTIFISNKLRTTLYMAAIITCTIIYGEIALYVIVGVWFLDEYIFHNLSTSYKQKWKMNKEIDLREE